ncbi:type IV pilus modification PilV family protein [Caminibacter pacificus]|uniref:Type II secretion system protein n=1 Tax=Caminibacter pacificus TaxID=1424653 RepID=A0AAJ4UX32_9BACT|nr:type II secretion system protein [Caminibacter pacificus]QCI27418.1 type II secretion system protein [Caminibacter pacificus]ROR38855.1 hypothetical protein EDC58_1770 [Caminibacter pacificus]
MRAFTLIEVLISVMILFFAAAVFLNLSSDSFSLYEKFKKRNDFLLDSSLVFCEKRGGRLDEVVRDFNITDDFTLDILKRKKINFEKRIDLKTQIENKNIQINRLVSFDKENRAEVFGVEVK